MERNAQEEGKVISYIKGVWESTAKPIHLYPYFKIHINDLEAASLWDSPHKFKI